MKIRDFALEHVRAKYPRTLGALECYSTCKHSESMEQPVTPSPDTELTSLTNWEDLVKDLVRYPVKVCSLQILFCDELFDVQGVMLMVVGLPNVGKSTIINGLKQIGFGTARHTGQRIWAKHLGQTVKQPVDSSFDFDAKQTLRNF